MLRSEEVLRKTMENAPVGMCLVAPDGSFMTANDALCALLGRTQEELLRTTWQELTHPDDLDLDLAYAEQLLRNQRDSYRITKRYMRPDGTTVWGDLSVACVRDQQGRVEFFISQIADVTDAKEREIAGQRALTHYRSLAENSSDVIIQVDPKGQILWISQNCFDALGHSSSKLIGSTVMDLIPEDERGRVAGTLAHFHRTRQPGRIEVPFLTADGSQIWMDVASRPMYDATGTYLGRLGRLRDISDQVAQRQDLEHRATHDQLTGLLSRDEGYERLGAAIEQARLAQASTMVAFIDVDDLKTVNDELGHRAGDVLLKTVSSRILEWLRDDDTIARIGGDELIAILPGLHSPQQAVTVMEGMIRHVHQPIDFEGHTLSPMLSIGVTELHPGDRAEDVVARADLAMYEVKQSGGNAVHLT